VDLSLFAHAMLVGALVATPVGPIGTLCVGRTLEQGRLVGMASAAGAATADALYAAAATLGISVVSSVLARDQSWLRVVGGIFLMGFGLLAALRSVRPGGPLGVTSVLGAYASTLLLTAASPSTILALAALLAGLGLAAGWGPVAAATVGAGVFTGSALLWTILVLALGLIRKRVEPRHLGWVARAGGVLIALSGVAALMGAVR
jgi:putative LysE/RhtB family amino acid efflux pump